MLVLSQECCVWFSRNDPILLLDSRSAALVKSAQIEFRMRGLLTLEYGVI